MSKMMDREEAVKLDARIARISSNAYKLADDRYETSNQLRTHRGLWFGQCDFDVDYAIASDGGQGSFLGWSAPAICVGEAGYENTCVYVQGIWRKKGPWIDHYDEILTELEVQHEHLLKEKADLEFEEQRRKERELAESNRRWDAELVERFNKSNV